MPSIADKRTTFRKLHETGCFVIPNPWNVGTVRYFQHLGFKALATTSSGFAHVQGCADGAVPRAIMLEHLREIAGAADVPVNADFEGGYAVAPQDVAESVRLCVETGIAGLSIEDSTGDAAKPLYDFDLALARVRAARAAIDKAGGDVVFTARTEGFIRGRPDLDETIRRLKAFADAGADCLYPPGIKTRGADRGGGAGGCAKAGQSSHVERAGLHRRRYRGNGRAPDQRWWHACARRLERGAALGARNCRARQVRQLRRRRLQRRAQRFILRRRKEAMITLMLNILSGRAFRALPLPVLHGERVGVRGVLTHTGCRESPSPARFARDLSPQAGRGKAAME